MTEEKRGKQNKRLVTIENKLVVTGGEVGAGTGETGRELRVHLLWWALSKYKIAESLYCTAKTNTTL